MSTPPESPTRSPGAFPPEAVEPVRPLLHLLATGTPLTVRDLVEGSGLPRRTVVDTLRAAGLPAGGNGALYALSETQRSDLHALLLERDRLRENALQRLDDLPALFSRWHRSVPAARADLDHVQATAETVIDRVRRLIDTHDPARNRYCFLGDHDLTAPALAAVLPGARIVVVDIDDELLRFIDGISADSTARAQSPITTAWADLRIGVPPSLRGGFDVVFTDPPYTDEGIALFTGRALECLDPAADPPGATTGRVLIAYGHSRLRPDLGRRVQASLLDRGLVIDELVRGFNRYHGAEALGSRSDLYVCQPTTEALRRTRTPAPVNRLYTHGSASAESVLSPLTESGSGALADWLSGHDRAALLVTGLDGSPDLRDLAGVPLAGPVRLDTLITKGCDHAVETAVLDLRGWPTDLTGHALIAMRAARFEAIVIVHDRETRPGTGAAKIRSALEIVCPTAVLTRISGQLHSISIPPRHEPSPWDRICDKPHGTLKNVWREALIADASGRGSTLTKNQARERIDASGLAQVGGLRLVDLPFDLLHRLRSQTS